MREVWDMGCGGLMYFSKITLLYFTFPFFF